MKQDKPPEFELDPYMEKLLALRESEAARFNSLPEEVKKMLEKYEREKQAAKLKGKVSDIDD